MGHFMLPMAMLAATAVSVYSKQIDSPEVGVPYLYKGMIVWAFFWAFLDAYTIGANDVANAFANAVGSGTLTHRSACLIACVCELIGVIGLGKNVTDTIRKKMVKVNYFYHDPYTLAMGMSLVNVGSGGWVLAATLLSMPVSTTHSVVGATIGIGLAAFGTEGVEWRFEKKGFLSVVASWFISPALSGLAAAMIYMSCKILVRLPSPTSVPSACLPVPRPPARLPSSPRGRHAKHECQPGVTGAEASNGSSAPEVIAEFLLRDCTKKRDCTGRLT